MAMVRISQQCNEKFVVRQVMDYLAARRVFPVRLNTAAIFAEHKGKRRMFRAHSLGPGAADIVVLPPGTLWIECKALDGKQSVDQKLFEEWVETFSHKYIVAHSIDDLKDLI